MPTKKVFPWWFYGDDEMKSNEVVLKQMVTGEQNAIELDGLTIKFWRF